jgi:hypothetical protein
MPPSIEGLRRTRWQKAALVLVAIAIASLCPPKAFALITGGEGNAPINDPGWPKGAAAIFNTQSRIVWWEGPPFGGGQWHSECRGDAKALNDILASFAKLDQKNKRVIVHDGIGHSFWLNPNRESAKRDSAKIDWVFLVWQPGSWKRLQAMPADLKPQGSGDPAQGPPAQIDVFAGGNIRWADVKVPKGLEVVDQRLEAHGFTTADGVVLEGRVFDLATLRPVAGRVKLQLMEPMPKGGYRYTVKNEMVRSARILVTVDFAGAKRPEAYIVEIAPEGGNVVGSWGGSANIDTGNQFMFRDVPPGRYTIKGRPNPSSANQESDPVTIEIKGGQASRITLSAK